MLSVLAVLLAATFRYAGGTEVYDRPISLDSLSLASIRIEAFRDTQLLYTATGFIVRWKAHHFLVTNWHVVTGIDPGKDTLLVGVSPGWLRIELPFLVPSKSGIGKLIDTIALIETVEGKPKKRWLEHRLGKTIDVVAFPLMLLSSADEKFIAVDIPPPNDNVMVDVAADVSVVGFPEGLVGSGTLGIWKTGTIASEPDLDYAGLPSFLIDVRTIGGMSGAPVYFHTRNQPYVSKTSGRVYGGPSVQLFLGVYSGRTRVAVPDKMTKSDIGIVWKWPVIIAILESAGY